MKSAESTAWVNDLLQKNPTKSIPDTAFMHEEDKKALAALKAIPFFDKICSKFIAVFNENIMAVNDMSTKIRITDKQLPRIYNMVENISKKLGIEMPALYLELNRDPNAYTYGNTSATITVTAGLLECLEDDEIYAVLAHECGHIACKHVLYHTMGNVILNGGISGAQAFDDGIIGALISVPLKLAFYKWLRCSEFSADRAAAICCEDAKPVVETMMRLAGGTTHINSEIDTELFIQQAAAYEDMVDDKTFNRAIELLLVFNQSHPLLSVRASSARQWATTDEFKRLSASFYE